MLFRYFIFHYELAFDQSKQTVVAIDIAAVPALPARTEAQVMNVRATRVLGEERT